MIKQLFFRELESLNNINGILKNKLSQSKTENMELKKQLRNPMPNARMNGPAIKYVI